ncbi:MAG: prepilin peptidase [Rickettsiales bacterium]|nr:prepilin peptidase [Rickettsiales bacterium]
MFGILIATIFGAVFGSYATLFAYRLPLKESCFGRYFGPKSRCPKCDKIITTRELIPLINWLVTLGKCSNCQTKIPKTHLFIELSTTTLFIISYLQFGFSEQFILFSLIATALIVLIVTDYTHKTFPDSLLNFILMIGLANRILEDQNVINSIYSATFGVLCAIAFYKLFFIKINNIFKSQEQVFDYAKLILIISIILQPQLFVIYFAAILIIFSFFSLTNIATKSKKGNTGYVLIIPLIFLMFYPPYILI